MVKMMANLFDMLVNAYYKLGDACDDKERQSYYDKIV